MPKPSIEGAIRAARSQRSWGFAILSAAATGVLLAILTREGYWWLLAGGFMVVALILIGTAKARIKVAVAMRAAHIQTMRGFRATRESNTDAGVALMAAMDMVGQVPGVGLDEAFDMVLDEMLSRLGY